MIAPITHDLDQDELTALVADLAARPETWQHLVAHRADSRTYVELHRDRHVAVWLICWMNDHDTGYHDHDLSAGSVAVTAGAVPGGRPRGRGAADAGRRPRGDPRRGRPALPVRPRRHPPRKPRRERAGGHDPRV